MWDFITCPLQFSPVKCMLSNYVLHNSGSTYFHDLLLFIAQLSFCWRRSALKICKFILISWKWNWIFQDGTFEMEVDGFSGTQRYEKIVLKWNLKGLPPPLTPLIGSKWCFHFINNSGSYRTKKGPSRLKSEGGKTQKYKMKLERELLISMPEFQSRHKKKRS